MLIRIFPKHSSLEIRPEEGVRKDGLGSAFPSPSSPVGRIWPTTLNVGLQGEGKTLLQLVHHTALHHAGAIWEGRGRKQRKGQTRPGEKNHWPTTSAKHRKTAARLMTGSGAARLLRITGGFQQLGRAITWGEERDGLHQHVLLLVQLQLLQHAVELHQRVQQKLLEATCGWVLGRQPAPQEPDPRTRAPLTELLRSITQSPLAVVSLPSSLRQAIS